MGIGTKDTKHESLPVSLIHPSGADTGVVVWVRSSDHPDVKAVTRRHWNNEQKLPDKKKGTMESLESYNARVLTAATVKIDWNGEDLNGQSPVNPTVAFWEMVQEEEPHYALQCNEVISATDAFFQPFVKTAKKS